MLTKTVVVTNADAIKTAEALNTTIPEEQNAWADLWLDLEAVYAAHPTTVEVAGIVQKVIKVCAVEGDSFLIEDTPVTRKALNERFDEAAARYFAPERN